MVEVGGGDVGPVAPVRAELEHAAASTSVAVATTCVRCRIALPTFTIGQLRTRLDAGATQLPETARPSIAMTLPVALVTVAVRIPECGVGQLAIWITCLWTVDAA